MKNIVKNPSELWHYDLQQTDYLHAFYSIVFSISKICQSIIAFEAISISNRVFINSVFAYWYKLSYRTILNYLRINFPFSFNKPKYYCLPFSPTSSNTSYSSRTEIVFINLNFASCKRTFLFTMFNHYFL